MGSGHSEEITSHSAFVEFMDLTYTRFKKGEITVRRPDGEFGCPFCAIKEGDPSDYTRLLQHANRVEHGSISGKQRAKHTAMAKYLAINITAEKDEEELQKNTPTTGRKRSRISGRNTTATRTPPKKRKPRTNWEKVAAAEEDLRKATDKIHDLEKTISEKDDLVNALTTKAALVEKTLAEQRHKIRDLEKTISVKDDLANVLTMKDRMSNDELQLVRRELIKVLSDSPWADETIGILKIGELDEKVFINELHLRYPHGDSDLKGVELCSMWQEKLRDPQWYPFQIVEDENGNAQRLINDEDLTLFTLKEEWGVKIHDAVVNALTAIQEHNSSELWNFGLKRKATLDEVIRHIFEQVAEGKGEHCTGAPRGCN